MKQNSIGTCKHAGLALSALMTALLWGSTAHAVVTINVNTTANNTTDNGLCSLREAIYSANFLTSLNGDCPAGASDGTIIDLGSSTYTTNVALTLFSPVTIRGNGVNSTTIRGNLSASVATFFYVYGTGQVRFESLTVDGGTLAGDTAGITVFDAQSDNNLHLQDAAVRDFTNSGIRSTGAWVNVVRSSVFDNSTAGSGGGIYIVDNGSSRGSLSLSQSAIHDNHANSHGGGIYFAGAGINQWNDSTISTNYAGTLGGGVYLGHEDYVQMNRLTIADNDAWSGGAFYRDSGNLYIYDSVLGDNTAVVGSHDGNGLVSDAQYSLFEGSSGISFITSGNLILGSDPKLGALQTWPSGVPTKVHPLLSTSPAINRKSTSSSSIDQRGFSRCVGSGTNKCDIGAFERH